MVKTIGRERANRRASPPISVVTNADPAAHAVLSTPLPYNLSHADAARDS